MLNKLFFSKTYTKEIACDDKADIIDNLHLKVFKLKDDPYHGVDPAIEKHINTKYLAYQEKDSIFLYYSRAFLEAPHSGEPFFPYFKGILSQQGDSVVITGKIKYNNFLDIMLPVTLLGMVVLVLSLKLHFAFLAIPVLLLLIVRVSASNLEKEMITEFGFSVLAKQEMKPITK